MHIPLQVIVCTCTSDSRIAFNSSENEENCTIISLIITTQENLALVFYAVLLLTNIRQILDLHIDGR